MFFFAFHPKSEFSGMEAREAVFLIEDALSTNKSLPVFACQLIAYHESDPFDPNDWQRSGHGVFRRCNVLGELYMIQ